MAATPGLHRKLQQTLGAEAAGDLVAWMQSMDAHHIDIGDLRRDMGGIRVAMGDLRRDMGDMRVEMGDLRREMQVGFARIDGRLDTQCERTEKLLEKGLREQTRFFFLAWSVLLAALIGLYAR
jgi:hypothetical protein